MKKRVTFLVTKEMYENLKTKAWENKKNTSEYIREVLEKEIEKKRK